MSEALEDQKSLADATSAEAVKAAFTAGVQKGSELQMQPLHSSTLEQEAIHYTVEQCPIMLSNDNGLHSVYLLRPGKGNVMGPSMVNNARPIQSTVKLSVFSANKGVTDSNKTVQMMSSFNIGKKYNSKTNLKFSEGSVYTYESFGSQFNFHHIMLVWDNHRAGIELYISL